MKKKLIYITAPDMSTATALAKTLIEEKLAACINILPQMQSYYRWEGKVTKDSEIPIFAKTTANLEKKLINKVKEIHPFDIPCIISLNIEGGNLDFLKWIESFNH